MHTRIMTQNPIHSTGRGQLSQNAAAILVQNVAAAASRGVPLPDVLEALADDVGDRRLARAANRLAERLRSGATLKDALGDQGQTFPPQVRGILLAGVEANDLPLVLEGYVRSERQRRHVNNIVRSALSYPVLIVVLLIPVLLILSLYVAPVFEELFREFQLELPDATLLAFRTAHVMPFALAALLFLPAVIAAVLSVAGGHWLLHRLRGSVPVFGGLWTWAGQCEFASLLGVMVAARLPLPQAVQAAAEAIADRNIARACPHLVHAVKNGIPLGEALERSMHFDRMLAPLVSWGEQHGLLDEALRIAAEVMRERLEGYAVMLRRVIPVVALAIVAALLAGLVIAGFLMPLLSMISAFTPGGGSMMPQFFGIW